MPTLRPLGLHTNAMHVSKPEQSGKHPAACSECNPMKACVEFHCLGEPLWNQRRAFGTCLSSAGDGLCTGFRRLRILRSYDCRNHGSEYTDIYACKLVWSPSSAGSSETPIAIPASAEECVLEKFAAVNRHWPRALKLFTELSC